MALDRRSIEKRDFPTVRRGYDQDAVHAHLARVADEVERLGARPAASLAGAAGERIQPIVEAAERTAADIVQQAREEAAATRAEAAAEPREHVRRTIDAAGALRVRLGEVERELGELVARLQACAEDLRPGPAIEATPSRDDGARETTPPPVPAAEAETKIVEPEDEPAAPKPSVPEPAPAPEPPSAAAPAPADAAEGARLVALNMALEGRPRAETERYLAENFSLTDAGSLLDEVYATAEG